MAVANHAASVQGVALRVTRLDAGGNPLQGPEDVYVTRAFMRVSFTPEYEEGDEITEKNAAGEVCVTHKALDTLKRATMELAVCDPDPELTELLTGGVLLKYGPDGLPVISGGSSEGVGTKPPTWPAGTSFPDATVGYAAVKSGESPNPNGVGIEVWSLAIRNGARDNELPYYRWVFPKAQLRPSGDRVIENGLLANAFEGWSDGNINFGTGPADDWSWPDATDRPFLYARDWTQPWNSADGNGWWTVPASAKPNPGEENSADITMGTAPNDKSYYYYIAENPADSALAASTGDQKLVDPNPRARRSDSVIESQKTD